MTKAERIPLIEGDAPVADQPSNKGRGRSVAAGVVAGILATSLILVGVAGTASGLADSGLGLPRKAKLGTYPSRVSMTLRDTAGMTQIVNTAAADAGVKPLSEIAVTNPVGSVAFHVVGMCADCLDNVNTAAVAKAIVAAGHDAPTITTLKKTEQDAVDVENNDPIPPETRLTCAAGKHKLSVDISCVPAAARALISLKAKSMTPVVERVILVTAKNNFQLKGGETMVRENEGTFSICTNMKKGSLYGFALVGSHNKWVRYEDGVAQPRGDKKGKYEVSPLSTVLGKGCRNTDGEFYNRKWSDKNDEHYVWGTCYKSCAAAVEDLTPINFVHAELGSGQVVDDHAVNLFIEEEALKNDEIKGLITQLKEAMSKRDMPLGITTQRAAIGVAEGPAAGPASGPASGPAAGPTPVSVKGMPAWAQDAPGIKLNLVFDDLNMDNLEELAKLKKAVADALDAQGLTQSAVVRYAQFKFKLMLGLENNNDYYKIGPAFIKRLVKSINNHRVTPEHVKISVESDGPPLMAEVTVEENI